MRNADRWFYVVVTLAFYGALAAVLFWLAGTVRLPYFWAVLGAQAVLGLVAVATLDTDMMSERMHPRGEDQDRYGRLLLSVLWVGQLAVASLDVGRLHIGDAVPAVLQQLALLVHLVAWLGFYRAVRENRYFSSAVRLQADRGQEVVTSGPYGFVRHPGYSLASFLIVGQGVALGSWLTLIPAMLIVAHLMKRTRMEERILVEKLDGYADYMRAVRYRWIPGVW